MALLGIDVGTTHCKAGLFTMDGAAITISSRKTPTHYTPKGHAYFDPEELWQTVAGVIQTVTAASSHSVAAIGIASMAETGLLLDRNKGNPRSNMIPWFDTAAQPQATRLADSIDLLDLYLIAGLRVNYKCSLAKILWLRDHDPDSLQDAIWLSAADTVAFRLTQAFGTDYSLAGRTCAFNIGQKRWDEHWLGKWDITTDLFPTPRPSGTPVGKTTADWQHLGLPPGIPVAISGHDHVCGAVAAGAVTPGLIFDSMGTAEGLVGAFPERPLTEADFRAGLSIGCHAASGKHYWMGGLSTSGGAIEWLRSLLNTTPLTYEEILGLLETTDNQPTGLLFFPYLLGSASPHSDPMVRGAFVGLRNDHTRADLVKAVLEGTAYEIEVVRRAGEKMAGQPMEAFIVAGGGTRNPFWLQIKADVSGCKIQVSSEPETTLLGAAVLAGIGAGLYANQAEALTAIAGSTRTTVYPDEKRHQTYRTLFESGYLRLQEPLRDFAKIDLQNS